MTLGSLGVDRPLYEIKAELFKALGHPARIRILELLADDEVPVSSLLTDTGMEPSHLSQHLAVLRRAGVVASRREGNAVYYRTAHPSVEMMLAAAREFLVDALSRTHSTLTALAVATTK
ncbi:MAG: metalloregulator ArsR/SmtB family transcription factor [Candidatus Nanopelagicales bacterium]|jgi:ArsR family transcriptional regulator